MNKTTPKSECVIFFLFPPLHNGRKPELLSSSKVPKTRKHGAFVAAPTRTELPAMHATVREPVTKLSLVPKDVRGGVIHILEDGMTLITMEHVALKPILSTRTMKAFRGRLDTWLATICPHPKIDRAVLVVIVSFYIHIMVIFFNTKEF